MILIRLYSLVSTISRGDFHNTMQYNTIITMQLKNKIKIYNELEKLKYCKLQDKNLQLKKNDSNNVITDLNLY